MDGLLTLVADRYRTDESRAVLAGVQAAARRSGWGRQVRPVFWSGREAAGEVEPLLRGADVVALVLEVDRPAEGDALLAAWEASASARRGAGIRALPVIVTGAAAARAAGEWLSRLARLENVLPAVLIGPCADIRLEHGGIASLSEQAQRALEERMRSGGGASSAVVPSA